MSAHALLHYIGHASLRITAPEGAVLYVDPFAGRKEDYEKAADLILVTHDHFDHNQVQLVRRKPETRVITYADALTHGVYHTFAFDFCKVEAVQAGNNRNHDIRKCVGFVLTFSDGKTLYISGDTSKTEEMQELAKRHISVALFCCDGVYNMDPAEAQACAELVKAGVSVPYHTCDANLALYDEKNAGKFAPEGAFYLHPGEEMEID